MQIIIPFSKLAYHYTLFVCVLTAFLGGCQLELANRKATDCVRDLDCPAGEMCLATNTCAPLFRCNGDSSCPIGMSCINAACEYAVRCDAISRKCPRTFICKDDACQYGRCQSDAECAVGEQCDIGLGVCSSARCRGHSDCPISQLCSGGECTAPRTCMQDSECPLDAYCHSSKLCRARLPCLSSAECAADEYCEMATGTCFEGPRCPHPYGPQPELCNGIDDDCDGTIDEDYPLVGASCSGGMGRCAYTGIYQCRVDSQDVECSMAGLLPIPELCNGADDDCDGETDEDFTAFGTPCTVGLGQCAATGTYECSIDGSSLNCTAVAGVPMLELCDGIDNNCDGFADESFADLGAQCFSGVGVCRGIGIRVCDVGGNGTVCNGVAMPGLASTELCNGIDDDCAGEIDEDLTRSCSSICGNGIEYCNQGTWQFCTARSPSSEVCDNDDNDCNGLVDEGCPATWSVGP